MSDDSLRRLSDVELHYKLQQHGFPNLPVTETTRNILIKKLKNRILNESIKKEQPKRSKTLTAPFNKVSPTTKPQTRFGLTRSNINNINNMYRTEHNSILGDRHGKVSGRAALGSYATPNSNYNHYSASPRIYVPPPVMASDLQQRSGRRGIHESAAVASKSERESPGVVSRLLKLRDVTIRRPPQAPAQAPAQNQIYLSDSDSDGGNLKYSKRPNRPSTTDDLLSRLIRRAKFKHTFVPYALIGSFGLFFVILTILYMTKPPDMPSTMIKKSTTFTTCSELTQTSDLARPSLNCIEEEMVANAIDLDRELIQLLQTNAEQHYCKDRSKSFDVSGADLIKHLYRKRSIDAHKLLRSFHAALYLIEQNPQWKISILNRPSGNTLPDIYNHDIRFALLKPYLPLKCILFNKIQRFFLIIGTVFLVGIVACLFYVSFGFMQQKRNIRLMAVENFIKEITKELVMRAKDSAKDANNSRNGSGEIIINHLRDKLIPLNKRSALLWSWNEALRKLEASDSRIQFGSTLQDGEEFRTMKWVETTLTANSDDRPKKKQWQSPAFDNVNKIFNPPTPCLKIRHMFDSAEAHQPDLKQNIVEAILEKVGSQCKILDIQLDKQSCCVYIRCASEQDAGIVHNEINGWWFDNRLVSIKFLRLQRYLSRFPQSGTTPISMKVTK